jgi:glycosyltransferase involved in cell wall biosynthesis
LRVDADALVVAYCGTLAAWQMPDASIRLFKALKLLRPDARLFFLTPDEAAAREALAAADVDDAIVRSAPAGETARLLCAADYGLLLRRDDTVNRVACPVKFGEYLACGVRPILAPHIGDQSEVCGSADLGVVVGLANPADAARIVDADAAKPGVVDIVGRERRRTWASENISPERAAARVAEFVDRAVPR